MSGPLSAPGKRDLIGIFVRHPTAANLLMVAMIVAGLFALDRLTTQFFPNFGIDVIRISVEWRGASADDVDTNIIQAIEPEVRFLDGVKKVTSRSVEGLGTLSIEFEPGSDMQAALSNVETAVSQVTTLPELAEQPEVRRIVRYDTITKVVLSGPFSEAALKAYAKTMRDDLLERGADKVDLVGARDEELHVLVDPVALRRLDLTLGDVAARIGDVSQDVPSGDTAGAGSLQIRSLGLEKTAQGLAGIELRAFEDGTRIDLDEVARIREAFDENDQQLFRNGHPAIQLHVQRALHNDALEVAAIVDAYLQELRPTLPPSLELSQYNVMSDLIESRIDLLLENGVTGLLLVLGILFLFLNARVAFWVAAGIPVALLATLVVMLGSGQSINMVSLFGLIMAIGILVDDAIVVGEHAEARRRSGLGAIEAAEMGAKRMLVPVMASSLTTIAAFTPLFVITDIIGQIIIAIPLVAVAVIGASLIECFLVLPGHMRHALVHPMDRRGGFRKAFDARFDAFRDGPFRRLVEAAIAWRYLTLSLAMAALIISFGLIMGGRVGFTFFAGPESDRLHANLEMMPGTSRAETAQALTTLQKALDQANAQSGEVMRLSLASLGAGVGAEGGRVNTEGDNAAGITVELTDSDQRDIRTSDFIQAWKDLLPPLPGVQRLTIIAAQAGPPGRDIDIQLAGGDLLSLKAAATDITGLLGRYPGVSDISDDMPFGKPEAILSVSPRGNALGFSTDSLSDQVRNSFEGAIAKRFARGDEEVLVRVRLPDQARSEGDLATLMLRSPTTGGEVLLEDVADRIDRDGFAVIQRSDGARRVAITAEIDKAVTSTGTVVEALNRDGIEAIAEAHGVRVSFEGKAEEQRTTFGDMRTGALLGLAGIYIILAWVFGSYSRPFLVMAVIPLGFIGAVIGHMALGFDLTILSMVALIGLSGIVVNDSIILVSTIDEHIAKSERTLEAIVNGTCERLRAVILTSLTTIGGLTPLLFETSLQAQFLIPMAVTIVFGLMVTTLLVLFVVPSLLAVQRDIGRGVSGLWRFVFGLHAGEKA
ncbi:MAG: efflux RND transporter permease subunit [Magnetovibrionaceae bacterium]